VNTHAELKRDAGERTAKSTAQSPVGGLISDNGAISHALAKANVFAGSDK